MARTQRTLTDEQWAKIEPLIPKRESSRKGGRPPRSNRECFEGILWILRSGARWKDLPDCFPSPSTCWRRLDEWERTGVLVDIWHVFLDTLDEKGQLDWEEVFVDATFVPAKKGATESGRPSVAKARNYWWWRMAREFLWHVGQRQQLRRR